MRMLLEYYLHTTGILLTVNVQVIGILISNKAPAGEISIKILKQSELLLNTWLAALTHFNTPFQFPCQCTLSLPTENIGKPYGLLMFWGGRERVHWGQMG